MAETPSILSFTADAFIAWASEQHGVPRAQALDVYRRALREGVIDPAHGEWARLTVAPIVREDVDGETIKFVQRHDDKLETESVIIPMTGSTGNRTYTLCVSSQVGCAMGCAFCETAQMGLLRNLTVDEIVGQWFAARFTRGAAIKNIVFMGMGEPMDNLDAVIDAILVLCDQNGAAIPPANITVSTVGRPEGIRRLGEFARRPGFRRLNLAISINAPNDAIRRTIMPITKAHPLDELFDAIHAWLRRPNDVVCIEYVLIPGVNDAPEHADELADRLRTVRCAVNVIPYNPRRNSPWPAPSEDAVQVFINRLRAQGQFTKRRGTKGRSAMAACGQLGNPNIRMRKFVNLSEADQSGPVRAASDSSNA